MEIINKLERRNAKIKAFVAYMITATVLGIICLQTTKLHYDRKETKLKKGNEQLAKQNTDLKTANEIFKINYVKQANEILMLKNRLHVNDSLENIHLLKVKEDLELQQVQSEQKISELENAVAIAKTIQVKKGEKSHSNKRK
jgi:hypothetical protein